MNRPALVLVALLGTLLLSGCSESATEESGDPTLPPDMVSGIDLPRVGTIGIHPAAAKRLVMNVDAGGRIVVDGAAVALGDVPAILKPRADADREEREPCCSRLFVVLRMDRTVPWGVAQWLMQACADPDVAVDRINFAVLPEEGDKEGSLAAHLPRPLGLPPRRGSIRERVPLEIEVLADGPGSVPSALPPEPGRSSGPIRRCRAS